MNRRRVLVLVLDIALLVAAAALIVLHPWSADRGTSERAVAMHPAAGQSTTRAGRRAQAREVRRALDRLETDPDALVAAASRDTVGDRARTAVPAGTKVTPIQRTWAPDGTGGGTMTVKVASPGKAVVTYATVMVHEPDGWKVAATFPLQTP